MTLPPSSQPRLRAHGPTILAAVGVFLLAVLTARARHVTGDLQLVVADSLGEQLPLVNAIVTGPNAQSELEDASDNIGHCKCYCRASGLGGGEVSL